MIERRPGGESGVTAVQTLVGDAIWAAAERGLWSAELGLAALAVVDTNDNAKADGAVAQGTLAAFREAAGADAALCLLEYSDGFKAALLHGQGEGSCFSGWAYAARVDGNVLTTAYNGNEAPNYPPFSYLCANIERMFETKRAPWPVERTLLVTGALVSHVRKACLQAGTLVRDGSKRTHITRSPCRTPL